MSQRFLNGTIVAKARMAEALIAEVQSFNSVIMQELYPVHEEALGHAMVALEDIVTKLREADHDDKELSDSEANKKRRHTFRQLRVLMMMGLPSSTRPSSRFMKTGRFLIVRCSRRPWVSSKKSCLLRRDQ